MIRSVVVVLSLMLVLMAGNSLADVEDIDNEELARLLADGALVIDVRTSEEWENTGLVEGSYPLTFFDAAGRYDVAAWIDALNTLSGDTDHPQPVILLCATGVRSAAIAELLHTRLGFDSVYNVERGIVHWLEQDLPVVPYAGE